MSRTSKASAKRFRDLIERHVCGFFPGAHVEPELHDQGTTRGKPVSYADGYNSLKLRSSELSPYRTVLKRSQRFSPEERELVDSAAVIIAKLVPIKDKDLVNEARAAIALRIIVAYIGIEDNVQHAFRRAITLLEQWASETYEGGRISSGFVIDTTLEVAGRSSPLRSFSPSWSNDYLKVAAGGYDTFFRLTPDGRLDRHEVADPPDSDMPFCPVRSRQIASKTLGTSSIAGTLNRNGEIGIFSNGKLVFAKRHGRWLYFSHEQCVSKLTNIGSKSYNERRPVREAVYTTCLDVSFARTGGCICILTGEGRKRLREVVAEDDLIETSGPSFDAYGRRDWRPKPVAASVKGMYFQDVDRRIMQEVCGLDGALILSNTGEIVAAGVIVAVKGHKGGGGRYAAAQTLANYGVAIKISEDGSIQAFRNTTGQGPADELFKIG